MPQYLFENPKNGETIKLHQSMNEPHVYTDKEGLTWTRLWTNPQASIDTKSDPFSAKDFNKRAQNKKYTVGDLWDSAKEASIEREQKAGKDEIKERHYVNYSKKRRNLKHPDQNKTDTYTI